METFLISTIYYLTKLHDAGIYYIPILDFNPQSMYAQLKHDKNKLINLFEQCKINYTEEWYHHTLVRINEETGEYVFHPKIYQGSSMFHCKIAGGCYKNEIMIDVLEEFHSEKDQKLWMSVVIQDSMDYNSQIFISREEAIKTLFDDYKSEVSIFLQTILIKNLYALSNLSDDWDNFDKFKFKMVAKENPILMLYKDICHVKFEFHLTSVSISKNISDYNYI